MVLLEHKTENKIGNSKEQIFSNNTTNSLLEIKTHNLLNLTKHKKKKCNHLKTKSCIMLKLT